MFYYFQIVMGKFWGVLVLSLMLISQYTYASDYQLFIPARNCNNCNVMEKEQNRWSSDDLKYFKTMQLPLQNKITAFTYRDYLGKNKVEHKDMHEVVHAIYNGKIPYKNYKHIGAMCYKQIMGYISLPLNNPQYQMSSTYQFRSHELFHLGVKVSDIVDNYIVGKIKALERVPLNLCDYKGSDFTRDDVRIFLNQYKYNL